MQRNFDNRDFEQFLKQNADQYRMHPSEDVWKQIHNTLHSRRRWYYGIVASLLLITGAVVTWVMVNNEGGSDQITQNAIASAKPAVIEARNQNLRPDGDNSALVLQIPPSEIAKGRIPSIEIIPVNETADAIVYQQPVQPVTEVSETFVETSPVKTNSNDLAAGYEAIAKTNIPEAVFAETNKKNTEKEIVQVKANPLTQNLFAKTPPPSIAKSKSRKKFSYQLYFTPGVSYRRLSENKEVILAAAGGPNIPTNLALRDVEDMVTHKPDLGFELGLAVRYPLSNRINLKAGIQFNVNKYDIRAFSYSGEPATIAIQGSYQQTVTQTSYYRNFSGYRPNWLTNVYFSVSAPIGAEVSVIKTKDFELGAGLTAQPTYMLNNKAYLISTDFKNYARVPDLMRRWNLNAGAELFVGFNTKRTRWQIGPQVRYQTRSSFKDKYPVKENLFNYGLKAGIILNH